MLGGVAAPVIFATLPAHDPVAGLSFAGTLFGLILGRFLMVSWGLGGLWLVTMGARAAIGARPRRLAVRVWIVLLMLASSVGTSAILIPRIERIQQETPGAIASLADTDARKITFGRLHGLANGLMLLTLVGGLVLVAFEVRDAP